MPKRLGVSIVGLGRIAQKHLQAVKNESRCELVALCSRSKEKASEWSHRWGARYKHGYTSYEKMIKRDDVDIVYICTPNKFHKDETVAAAESGKHIFLEKPIARSAEETEEMIKAVHEASVNCLIGNQERFMPQVEMARSLAGKILGKIFLFRSLFMIGFHAFFDEYGKKWSTQWRFDPDLAGGGEFLDDSAKRLDTFRWIARCDVKRIVALSAKGKLIKECKTDDVNLAMMEFTNGSWGSLGGSYFNVFNHWPLEIYGTEGAFFLDVMPPIMTIPNGPYPPLLIGIKKPVKETLDLIKERHQLEMKYSIFSEENVSIPHAIVGISFSPKKTASGSMYLYPYKRELSHLVNAISKGEPLRTPIEDYYKTLKAIWAAYRSAQDGEWVNLQK